MQQCKMDFNKYLLMRHKCTCQFCGKIVLERRKWVFLTTFEGCRKCWLKAGKPDGRQLTRSLLGLKRAVRHKFTRECPECGLTIERKRQWVEDAGCCMQCCPPDLRPKIAVRVFKERKCSKCPNAVTSIEQWSSKHRCCVRCAQLKEAQSNG